MSVTNHLSLVDWMTVNPSHDRPGAGRGIRCPRPHVQLPSVSRYAVSLSLSAASRSTARRRSIVGSRTVSFVMVIWFSHLGLDVVDGVFDVVQRLLHRCVLLLDTRQLVIMLRYVRLSLIVLTLQVDDLLVNDPAVVDGRVQAAGCGYYHSDGGPSGFHRPLQHRHFISVARPAG